MLPILSPKDIQVEEHLDELLDPTITSTPHRAAVSLSFEVDVIGDDHFPPGEDEPYFLTPPNRIYSRKMGSASLIRFDETSLLSSEVSAASHENTFNDLKFMREAVINKVEENNEKIVQADTAKSELKQNVEEPKTPSQGRMLRSKTRIPEKEIEKEHSVKQMLKKKLTQKAKKLVTTVHDLGTEGEEDSLKGIPTSTLVPQQIMEKKMDEQLPELMKHLLAEESTEGKINKEKATKKKRVSKARTTKSSVRSTKQKPDKVTEVTSAVILEQDHVNTIANQQLGAEVEEDSIKSIPTSTLAPQSVEEKKMDQQLPEEGHLLVVQSTGREINEEEPIKKKKVSWARTSTSPASNTKQKPDKVTEATSDVIPEQDQVNAVPNQQVGAEAEDNPLKSTPTSTLAPPSIEEKKMKEQLPEEEHLLVVQLTGREINEAESSKKNRASKARTSKSPARSTKQKPAKVPEVTSDMIPEQGQVNAVPNQQVGTEGEEDQLKSIPTSTTPVPPPNPEKKMDEQLRETDMSGLRRVFGGRKVAKVKKSFEEAIADLADVQKRPVKKTPTTNICVPSRPVTRRQKAASTALLQETPAAAPADRVAPNDNRPSAGVIRTKASLKQMPDGNASENQYTQAEQEVSGKHPPNPPHGEPTAKKAKRSPKKSPVDSPAGDDPSEARSRKRKEKLLEQDAVDDVPESAPKRMKTLEQREDEAWVPGVHKVQPRVKTYLDNRILGRKKVRLVSPRRSRPATIEIRMSTPGRASLADGEVAGQSISDDGDGDQEQGETPRLSYDRPKVRGILKYGLDSGDPHSAKQPEPEIQWNNGIGRVVLLGDVNDSNEAVHGSPGNVSLSPEAEQSNQGHLEQQQPEQGESEQQQLEQGQSEQEQLEQGQSEQEQPEQGQSEQEQLEQKQSEQEQPEQNQSEHEQPKLATRAKKTFHKTVALNQHPGNYWPDFLKT